MGRSRKGREKIKGGDERKEKFKFAFNVFLRGFNDLLKFKEFLYISCLFSGPTRTITHH